MKVVRISLILLLAGLSSVWAVEPPATITATHLADLPSLAWKGGQFIQADKEGHIFLLREEALEVYQLSGENQLTPRGRLLEKDPSEHPPFFRPR
jgi:hypothetical protein